MVYRKPDVVKQAVLHLYSNQPEMRIADIAAKYNVSIDTVSRWAKQAGLARHKSRDEDTESAPEGTWVKGPGGVLRLVRKH